MRIMQCVLPAVLLAALIGCTTVPGTGRSRLMLVPAEQMLALSREQYAAFLEEAEVSDRSEAGAMLERVGKRIAQTVEQWLLERGETELAGDFDWEFTLVEEDTINAWAMPGGKVVVYEGLLKVTQTEAGLAAVVAHEIAHAVAGHGGERMSQLLLAQLGGAALDIALRDEPQQTRGLWLTAFGIGAQVGAILPYSRLHETEADRLSLVFMARAGYDPREAVDLWRRMAEAAEGPRAPEFLSTHPNPESRIADMKAHMPEALAIYRRNARPL